MTPVRRWSLVVLGVIILLALPTAVGALPVSDSDVSAAELLDRVQAADSVAYSGYAQSTGGLQLPITSTFTDLVNLLGESTKMRVWWRSSDDWRVDTVDVTGEFDVFHSGLSTRTWEYESARAVLTPEPDIRLPRSTDLLPSELGQRLLSEATAEEVSRLPAQRIAGRDAPGLRMVPADVQSTVDSVDVWVDPDSGLPIKVMVYGGGSSTAAVTTLFLDLRTEAPPESVTLFTVPPGARDSFDDVTDIAAAANQFADARPPDVLAGLQRRVTPGVPGAVGEYGRGVTALVAVPLWDRVAHPLLDQLAGTAGAVTDEFGTAVSVGPLTVLLSSGGRGRQHWLVSGTVTLGTLRQAAAELAVSPEAQP